MTEEQYQGYELSDLDVKRFPTGQYYIGRDIKMGKHWQPYSVNSQAFAQKNQAIRHYSFMKTDQISKRVSNQLGTNNYMGLPERKPIYFDLQHDKDKREPSYTIDKERSRGSDFREFYERGDILPDMTKDNLYEPTHEHERVYSPEPEHSYENYGDPEPEYEYGFNDIEFDPERDYELKYGKPPEMSYEDLLNEHEHAGKSEPEHEREDLLSGEEPTLANETNNDLKIDLNHADPQEELDQMDDYLELCELQVQEYSIER